MTDIDNGLENADYFAMPLLRKEKSPLAFACGHMPPHI